MNLTAEARALANELLANDPRLSPEDAYAFAPELLIDLLAFAGEWNDESEAQS